jgi:hypothetical protein
MSTKRLSDEERMKLLLEKQQDITRELNNLRRSVAQTKRKQDAKRKVLAGACALHMVQSGRMSENEWTSYLDKFLTRPADRALFDLEKKPSHAA